MDYEHRRESCHGFLWTLTTSAILVLRLCMCCRLYYHETDGMKLDAGAYCKALEVSV